MISDILKLFKELLFIIKADALVMIPLLLLFADCFGTLPYYLGLILLPVLINKILRVKDFDKNLCIIIFFSSTYSLFALMNGHFEGALGYVIFYMFYPPIFYLLGLYFGDKYNSNICELLILFPIVMSIYPIVICLQDINTNEFINVTRELFDKNGNYIGSATLLGTKVSLIISFCASLFFPYNKAKDKTLKLIMLFFSILGIILTMHLVSRTGLFLAAACLISSILINYKYLTKNQYLLIFVGFFLFLYLFGEKVLSLLSLSEEAYLYRSDHGSTILNAGGRTDIWIKSLELLFVEPFGVQDTDRTMFNYAHNLWLDVSLTAGLIPFSLLIIITCRYVKSFISFYKKNSQMFYASLILSYNIALLLQCSVEPVADGCMQYFFYIFLLFGIINSYENKNSKCFFYK